MDTHLYSQKTRNELHSILSADEIALLRSNVMKTIEDTERSYNSLINTYDFICYHHNLSQAYLEYAYYTKEGDLIEEFIRKAEHSLKLEKTLSEFKQQIEECCYNEVSQSPDVENVENTQTASKIVLDNDVPLTISRGDDNITVSDVSEPLYCIDDTVHTPYFDFVSTNTVVSAQADEHYEEKQEPNVKLNIASEQDKLKEYNFTDHPDHYNIYDYEVIDMMEKIWGTEDAIKWCKMTAWKYRQRMGTKPGEPVDRDLKKERWYLDKAAELKSKLEK